MSEMKETRGKQSEAKRNKKKQKKQKTRIAVRTAGGGSGWVEVDGGEDGRRVDGRGVGWDGMGWGGVGWADREKQPVCTGMDAH